MKRKAFILIIHMYDNYAHIPRLLYPLDFAFPVTGIFTVRLYVLLNIEMFVGTVPVNIGVIPKIFFDFACILFQHSIPESLYIHRQHSSIRSFHNNNTCNYHAQALLWNSSKVLYLFITPPLPTINRTKWSSAALTARFIFCRSSHS